MGTDAYKETFDSWDKVADIYDTYFTGLDLYNDTYDIFCNYFDDDAQVFEIGCGPGNITQYLLGAKPGLLIDAIDVSANMLAIAGKNCPGANFMQMDCRDLSVTEKVYDGVLCGFCAPYLDRGALNKMMTAVYGMLCRGGVFYISAIKGDYADSGFEKSSTGDAMYVYYYSEDELRQLLSENGFDVVYNNTILYTRSSGASEDHLILIGRKS